MLRGMSDEAETPEVELVPEVPRREVLAGYLGKMLLARGSELPRQGEPWQLVQTAVTSNPDLLSPSPWTLCAYDFRLSS